MESSSATSASLFIVGGSIVLLVVGFFIWDRSGSGSDWSRSDIMQLRGFVSSEVCGSSYGGCTSNGREDTDCAVETISRDFSIKDWRTIASSHGSYDDFRVTLQALILSASEEC
jgi:hypothetical protein